MTIWLPQLEGRAGPRYLAIAQALAEDVEQGRLAPGDRLPTHRDLAYRLGVTVGTVSRAYLEAERRGLVQGEVGRGTFVRARATSADALLIRPEGEGIVDLSLNRPPVADTGAELARALSLLARRNDLGPLLAYQHELGLPEHRAAGAAWLARCNIAATHERIAVTCGAQHALYCALATATRPGDTILVEALTYPGFKSIAGQLGLQLQGVPIDGEGLIPEALDAAARQSQARLLFTIPTLQNPTTATMPEVRRHEIVEVARRHDLLILEDDIYGFLMEAPPPPLAALAPERVLYATSVSKSMAGGLRLGYALAPAAFIGRLGAAIRSTVWMAPPMLAEIVTRWIHDGTGDHLAKARRQQARSRQALAARLLAGQHIESHPASFHLWLHLPEPWRWSDFVAAAESRGVRVTPPDVFVIGRAMAPHAVRLCLSAVESETRLAAALATLAELLASRPEPRLAVL